MKASNIFLFIDGVQVPSNPIYADNISIEKERESEEMYHRTKVGATLTFVGEDFRRIYGSSLDSEFEVEIYDEETDWLMARGTFERTDCKFNLDDEICEVKISSADAYDKIVNGKKNEYDVVSLAPEREEITLTKRAILQVYVLHDTKITNIIGNMSYEVEVSAGIDVDDLTISDLTDDYNFEYITYDVVNLKINSMPSQFQSLVGEYSGEIRGRNTVLTQKNGVHKIVVGSQQLQQEGYFDVYFWKFLDGNDNTIHYSSGEILSSSVSWEMTPDTDRLSSFGKLKFIENPEYGIITDYEYTTDPSIDSEVREAPRAFVRVLMDDAFEGAQVLGNVEKIRENDICNTNLNYHYSMKPTSLINQGYLIIQRSAEVQREPTKYGVNGEGMYFVQPAPLNEGDNVIPIGWSQWIPKSLWLNSTTELSDVLDFFNTEWTLRDAYPLWSVIDVLLKQIDPDIEFRGTSEYSEFLYGNADLDRFVKQLWYITPITNVKKTYYDQAARKGKLTLENIFTMLRNTCQLYWFVDNMGRLRIEHISWFKNGGAYTQSSPIIDLTSILSPKSGKNWSFAQNTISFDKSMIANRYEFSWAEEVSEVFDGYAIDIHNTYAKGGKTIKASVDKFVSDIDLIVSAPDVLGDDNFALIGVNPLNHKCPVGSVTNFGMDFVVPNFIMQNPYFSFYFLAMAYWCNDLGGDDASFGDFKNASGEQGKLDVFDIVRAKKQSVKFPISPRDADKMGLIKTEVGNGEWVKSKHTIEDGMVEMELLLEMKEDISWGRLETSSSYLEFVATKVGNTYRFVLSGNRYSRGKWGFIKVTAKKPVTAEITANCSASTIGYLSRKPIKSLLDPVTPLVSVSGTDSNFYDFDTPTETFYIGYLNSSVGVDTSEDKIVVEINEL